MFFLAADAVMRLSHSRARPAVASALLVALLVIPSAPRAQNAGADLVQSFYKDAKLNLSFRYRYELVDEEPFISEANASTLRTRLAYQSAPYKGFAVLLEGDDVLALGDDDYNSTRNGKTDQPTVPDPTGAALKVAAIKYTGLANTEFIVGRQKIIRGNERFVGIVGWRQNEQTMDGASIGYKLGDKWQFYYAYVRQVNRVFGPRAGTPRAYLVGNTHLADVTYTFSPAAKLTAYGYLIGLDETPASSSETFGLRLMGDITLNQAWSLPYAAEFATQSDYASNPNRYHANYLLAEAGVKWQNVSFKLGYEVLSGSATPNHAFQTPLATGHPFQGWADKFLTTPGRGVKDAYAAVDVSLLGGNIRTAYHGFFADTGRPQHYANEFDAMANWPFARHYSVMFEYAVFSANSAAAAAGGPRDTNKLWVMLSANF
jgi:hypothetical protein